MAIARELESSDGEDQIAIRGEGRYVARLAERGAASTRAPIALRSDGAYLITGGLGGLGLSVARWMVDRGARQLVLLGRTPLPPRTQWAAAEGEAAEKISAILALEERGANVHIAAVDVADEDALRVELEAFRRERGVPVPGVIHAAGAGRIGPISELTDADLDADFGPKVLGAANLDKLLEGAPLDFFVLYSSLSAVLPSPLLAGYAASNAFLEGFARNRRARGKPALCVHWGMWGETGMAARAQRGSRRDWKVGSLGTKEALELQTQLLEEGTVSAIVTRTDWRELARENPALARLPLLSSLLGGTGEPAAKPAAVVTPEAKLDLATLVTLSVEAQVDRLVAYLKPQIEEVLALAGGALDDREPLDSVGYDSLAAVDLQSRISKDVRLEVPLLALLQRGTARDLAQRIAQQVQRPSGSERAPVAAPKPSMPAVVAPRGPSVRAKEISGSISLYPARTPTLPPATHTNSYALGSRDVVLVEPATPFEGEQRAWIEWARALSSSGRRPVAIFATHHHDDHIGGLDILSRELGLPVWMHRETWARVGGAAPDRLLEDGETIRLDGPAAEEWRVLHTPGHAPGHLCLWNPDTRTIVAGDMVASVGTILIAPGDGDMQSYLVQLERLAQLGADWALPAHGEPIAAPTALFRSYIRERETRERDVLAALVDIGVGGGTAENLVTLAYPDVPVHTRPIGLLSLRSHLEKLLREGRVVENDGVYRSCG